MFDKAFEYGSKSKVSYYELHSTLILNVIKGAVVQELNIQLKICNPDQKTEPQQRNKQEVRCYFTTISERKHQGCTTLDLQHIFQGKPLY